MEEEMIQRVHGIDRHKRSATLSVMDREGKEIKFIRSCGDLNSYLFFFTCVLNPTVSHGKTLKPPPVVYGIDKSSQFQGVYKSVAGFGLYLFDGAKPHIL